jgi:hypothetical protein
MDLLIKIISYIFIGIIGLALIPFWIILSVIGIVILPFLLIVQIKKMFDYAVDAILPKKVESNSEN